MLSVATAPIDGRQRFVAVAVIFILTAAALSLLPAAPVVVSAAPAFVPMLLGIAFAAQLVTAYLLMSQFIASRVVGTAFLGGAYLVGSLSVLAYGATFPGVIGSGPAVNVAPWVWIAWHAEFPIAVCLALWFDRVKRFTADESQSFRWLWVIVAGALVMVAVPAVLFVVAGDRLPSLMLGTGPRPLWQHAERWMIIASISRRSHSR